jgi:hypothetical protein
MISHGASVRSVIDFLTRPISSRAESAPFMSDAISVGPSARTEFSATVFDGPAEEWVRYLTTPVRARYEPGSAVRFHLDRGLHLAAFEAEAEEARWLAELLEKLLYWARERAARKPNVLALFDELLFEHPADPEAPPRIVLSPQIPSTGAREASSEEPRSHDTRFVLQSRLARGIWDGIHTAEGLSVDEKLGIGWPLVSRLLSQVAYPPAPRDRYVAKIRIFAKLLYLSVNLLYDGTSGGRLKPNGAGAAFEALSARQVGVAPNQLIQQHPYFRALARLSFVSRARPYPECADEARVVAREYLDDVYLRLSLASAMPELSAPLRAMSFERKGSKLKTPSPRVGSYGILDAEDRDAWKKVQKPFREIGFVLLRQIGMGDFGRVYEVFNQFNPEFPERLALKVDRILGRKKEAILEAEAAMRMGRELARAPHLVRLYDTGKLPGHNYTYHVLQLIEGDTLDALIQVTGVEHGSTGWPPSVRTSEKQAREEYARALRASAKRGDQDWRRRRMGLPFKYPLSAPMVLDVLTSVLLTVEEVHQLGYSINDLKNDNLMLSRRGLLKGIDLDAFARITTPYDKMTDFMFLAAAVILFVFNAPYARPRLGAHWKELAENEALLRAEFAQAWPFGNVESSSDGRVSTEELTELLVDLVQRCHQLDYAREPDLFSADIARVIHVKRRLRAEEFVID